MFWWLALATCWLLTPVAKNACLAISGSVFKPFQFSLELFMSIHFLSQLKLIQTLRVTLYKHHFCTCSPPNLQEKGMGSYFLTLYLVFWTSFSWVFMLVFCFFVFFVFFFFWLWVCFDVFGIVLVWIIEVLFLCKLFLVDRFMYFPVLVFLR